MRIQKGKVRFSKRDLWNLDYTLKPIIHTALTQFRDSHHDGVPNSVLEDYIVEERGISLEEAREWISNNRNEYGDVDGYSYEMLYDYFHDVILTNMIFAFEYHPDYYDIEKPPYRLSFDRVESEYGEEIVSSVMNIKLDEGITQADVDAYKERSLQYNKDVYDRSLLGRMLFARYFDALWT